MELRQLRYFIRVAEVGSFTRAAVALDVAQPALSRQVRDLELELGVSLLTRNGRGASLTEAGLKFLSRAKAIVEDTDRALEEMSALKGRPMGLVSIGMPPSIGGILTLPLIRRMRSAYPEIQLQITEGYSGTLYEWLLSGRIDVGVLYVPQRVVGETCTDLVNEHLYLLGRPDLVARYLGSATEVDAAELPALPTVMPGRPHPIRRMMDEVAAKKNLSFNIGVEINAFLAIRDYVLSGDGFTILPVSTMLADLRAGLIEAVHIVNPEVTQMVGLMTTTHHPLSVAGRAIVGTVQKVAQELIAGGCWPSRLPAVPADDKPVSHGIVRPQVAS